MLSKLRNLIEGYVETVEILGDADTMDAVADAERDVVEGNLVSFSRKEDK